MPKNPLPAARRVLIAPVLSPAALAGRASGLPVFTLEGTTMGTFWKVRGLLPPDLPLPRIRAALEEVFARVIRQMSHWDPASALCAFNRAPAGTWQELPDEFFRVLTRAVEIAAASGGCLDPTIGELVDLHGFGPDRPAADAAPEFSPTPCSPRWGWQRLRLDTGRQAALQPGGLRLDLSSIAKGFAVDLASESLTILGLVSHLVEIGGEVRGTGCKSDGSPWWCRIDPFGESADPLPASSSGSRSSSGTAARTESPPLPETLVALSGLSAATSADSLRQRVTASGMRLTHLIDPRTARPAGPELASVTVLTPACMEADAWATALFIAGPASGPAMAEARHLAALFTWRVPHGCHQTLSPALQLMAG